MDRFNLNAFSKEKENNEINSLKKIHREEKAQLVKSKAILEQQVELLTIQLHEASERERNLKKTYSTMISALQQQKQEGEEKIRVLKKQSSALFDKDFKSFKNKRYDGESEDNYKSEYDKQKVKLEKFKEAHAQIEQNLNQAKLQLKT